MCSLCKKIGHEASGFWANSVCGHCKKKGHPESRCFELVGYPDACPESMKTPTMGQERGQVRANAAASSSTSNLGQLFTLEQWKAISGLIGNAQIPDNRLNGKFDRLGLLIPEQLTM